MLILIHESGSCKYMHVYLLEFSNLFFIIIYIFYNNEINVPKLPTTGAFFLLSRHYDLIIRLYKYFNAVNYYN